ncbi:MAG: hypothetical protein PHE02_09945 [Lachnospiraceae bacterium]|nr:hypothetical protein [Lachnospiraceae bacterium]
MKILYRISLLFLVAAAFFYLGIVVKSTNGFQKGKENPMMESESLVRANEANDKINNNADNTKTKANANINTKTEEQQTNSYEAVSVKEESRISASTIYVVHSIQKDTGQTETAQESVPVRYIGLSREELITELQQYSMSPTLEDQERGFLSASLESFSSEKVIVSKIYETKEAEKDTYFFLVAENHKVTVYCSDQKTVYMNTEIPMDMLPEEIQNEILDTKCIEGEAELYNFLESYSS